MSSDMLDAAIDEAMEKNRLDAIMAAAPLHGWQPLYHDRYPHAGGPAHYAGWLENAAGFKVEVVADEARSRASAAARNVGTPS